MSVCMCICVSICMYACPYVSLCVFVTVWKSLCVHTCVSLWLSLWSVCVSVNACLCVCICICVHVLVCVSVHVCECVCICVSVYICVCVSVCVHVFFFLLCFHIAVIKQIKNTMTKTTPGEKGLFQLIVYSPPSRELRAGTWRQELKQRPSRNFALWFVPHGLLSLLWPPSQGWHCQWWAWVLSLLPSVKKSAP